MDDFPQFFMDEFINSPVIIGDVGARGGLQEHWKKYEKYLKTVLVEADPQAYDELLKTVDPNRQTVLGLLLHSQNKNIKFNITKAPGCSSLYSPNREFLSAFPEDDAFDIVETKTFLADTLDKQLAKHHTHLDFLKIDTQGSELDILKSAEESLVNDIFGIELEVEFVPLYEGQPLFADVDQYLRSLGFELFDLRHTYWKRKKYYPYGGPKGQLIFADALYFKKGRVFDKKDKALKAMFQMCVYGYIDCAATIFEEHEQLFTSQEKTVFMSFLKNHEGWYYRLPYFMGGRLWLVSLLERLQRAIVPSHHGWASAKKYLGNR